MTRGWMNGCLPLCLCFSLLAACSKPKEATLPVPAMTLNFGSGRPLTPARIAEIVPEFELTDPELVPAPLIFGSGRIESLDLREPLIVRRLGAIWSFVELPELNHTAWVYVGASYERNELWAILDSTPESKGAGLYLFRSTDHGQTWNLFSGVKPPTIQAEFVDFSMTPKGHGRLAVHQDDDTDAIPRGTYVYASADGGKTWSGPSFSPDDLISADTPLNPTLAQTIQDLEPSSTNPADSTTSRGISAFVPPSVRGTIPRPPARGRGR